jgi:signal transduction histidine kinase
VEERTRAARDLHDSVGHTLSLVIIQAGAARLGVTSTTPGAPERVASSLDAIETAARSALGALDQSAHEAHAGGEHPLAPAGDLHDLVQGVRAAGTTVDVTAARTDDLPATLQSTVFRLVQESLTNVVKHAPGARAAVQVDRSTDVVRVRVSNAAGNGTGPPLPSGGRGLTGMRERVALFGGRLDVGPDASGGYVVEAAIPLPAPVEAVAPTVPTEEDA